MAIQNTNYRINPSAINIRCNSYNGDPQHVIVGTSVGAKVTMINQWSTLTWDKKPVTPGYADSGEYLWWYVNGAQYHLSPSTQGKDVFLYVRTPVEGGYADISFSVEDLDPKGQYKVPTIDEEGNAVLDDDGNPTYTVKDIDEDDYYYIKLCKLRYVAETNKREVVDLDTGKLNTPDGVETRSSQIYIRRDKDDTAPHNYTFKSLTIDELIIGGKAHLKLDAQNNLKFFALDAQKAETAQNVYATGGVSAYGMGSGGSGTGGGSGSGDGTGGSGTGGSGDSGSGSGTGGNEGTVTSIGLTMPTGFVVSNSPVTGSGTIAVTLASGYNLLTDAQKNMIHTHYNATFLAMLNKDYDGFTKYMLKTEAKMTLWGNEVALGGSTKAPITIDGNAADYLVIGKYKLLATATGLQLSHLSDGTNANFYATGGVSAYGEGTNSAVGGVSKFVDLEEMAGITPANGQYWGYKNNKWGMYSIESGKTYSGDGTYINVNNSTNVISFNPANAKMTLWGNQVAIGGTTNAPITITGNSADYIQLGQVRLQYDAANNAVKVMKADGTAANFYALGGVSAYGYNGTDGNVGVGKFVDLEEMDGITPVNGQYWGYKNGKWGMYALEGGGGTYQGDNIDITVDNTNTIKLTAATAAEIAKGVTAYGWGDHASQGYLKSNAIAGMLTTSNYATTLNSVYAAKSHNHDTAYAALNHNHDTAYAALNHNHDSSYVSAVALSGDKLAVTKNGSTTNLTIPYATKAGYAEHLYDSAKTKSYTASDLMVFGKGGTTDHYYINASFVTSELQNLAGERYIEFYDGGKWHNFAFGRAIIGGGQLAFENRNNALDVTGNAYITSNATVMGSIFAHKASHIYNTLHLGTSGSDYASMAADANGTLTITATNYVTGVGNNVGNTNEVAFGKYNVHNSDTLLSVGYGTSSLHKNALEIKTGGDSYFGNNVFINDGYIKIGDYILQSTNYGLKLFKAGSSDIGNFYATGGISAYGYEEGSDNKVLSVNGLDGAITIAGGTGLSLYTDGSSKTIAISVNADVVPVSSVFTNNGLLKRTNSGWAIDTNTYLTASSAVTKLNGITGSLYVRKLKVNGVEYDLVTSDSTASAIEITSSGSGGSSSGGSSITYKGSTYIEVNSSTIGLKYNTLKTDLEGALSLSQSNVSGLTDALNGKQDKLSSGYTYSASGIITGITTNTYGQVISVNSVSKISTSDVSGLGTIATHAYSDVVQKFGGQQGEITVDGSTTTNGTVKFTMSSKKLTGSVVGLGDLAYLGKGTTELTKYVRNDQACSKVGTLTFTSGDLVLEAGDIKIANAKNIYSKDSSGNLRALATINSSNKVIFGSYQFDGGGTCIYGSKTIEFQTYNTDSSSMVSAANFNMYGQFCLDKEFILRTSGSAGSCQYIQVYNKTDASRNANLAICKNALTNFNQLGLYADTVKIGVGTSSKIQIGDAYISYDSTAKALKVAGANGTDVINFFATGGVSAYGATDYSEPTFKSLTLSDGSSKYTSGSTQKLKQGIISYVPGSSLTADDGYFNFDSAATFASKATFKGSVKFDSNSAAVGFSTKFLTVVSGNYTEGGTSKTVDIANPPVKGFKITRIEFTGTSSAGYKMVLTFIPPDSTTEVTKTVTLS